MNYRKLGKTNINISEVSLGTWQVGGKWGSPFDEVNADRILRASIENGVNFIDTADVYSDGLSEQSVGKVVRSYKDKIYIATKCGRRFQPHIDQSYTLTALRKSVEDSLANLGVETIDLIQLHCPPNDTYYRPEVFHLFDQLKQEGKIQALGVSVEKVEQAIKALQYDNVCSIQIIFNMFRQRPAELFFDLAKAADVGVIVRVPLVSGLLSGKFYSDSIFEKDDHRQFNRDGAGFDRGETFSGIDYATGLDAVEELKSLLGSEFLSTKAIRWPLMFDAVSCVIPGASSPEQAIENIKASNHPSFTQEEMNSINNIYIKFIKESVHQMW